tara:strand:+ start:3962 stop:4936 length:975 start_codon:yes stop_codon:yes gene_type:complete
MDIRKLTFFSTCFAFLVVALGAWTRLADAGLGCPDWPGCYGFFTLPTSPEEINLANNRFPATPYEVAKAIPEVFHRFFAAGLGLLIMGIFICIRRNSNADDSLKKISGFLLIWVIFQGVFGYLTVSLKLLPIIVTGHLLFGFLTTVLLWLLHLKILDKEDKGKSKWIFSSYLKRLIFLSIMLVTFQIFLGAWTSTNYASLSCPDFPLCQGMLIPEVNFLGGFNLMQEVGLNYLGGQMDQESRTAIHFVHRLGALLVTAFVLFLVLKLFNDRKIQIALIILILLVMQILLGISNIIFQLPLLIAVAHNLGALLLLSYLTALRYRH